jgi:hypothetical protein
VEVSVLKEVFSVAMEAVFSAGMARPQEKTAVVSLKGTKERALVSHGATSPPAQALQKKTIPKLSQLKTNASKRTKKANTCAKKNLKLKITP